MLPVTTVATNERMASKEARGIYQLSRVVMPSSTQRGGETVQTRSAVCLGRELGSPTCALRAGTFGRTWDALWFVLQSDMPFVW